ncbi:MAG: hypothetical protein HY608_12135, partial [Planctomycetes bacterium]|nr:hypothetical protein [Planctomycetota bacterium]
LSALWVAVLGGRGRPFVRRAAWGVLLLGPVVVAAASPSSGSRVSESACYVGIVGEGALRGVRTLAVRSLDGLRVSLDLPGDGWTPVQRGDAASGSDWEIGEDRTRLLWNPASAGAVLALTCEPHESFLEGDGVVLEREELPWLLVERGGFRPREAWRVDASGVRPLRKTGEGVWRVPEDPSPADPAATLRAWRSVAPWIALAEVRSLLAGGGFVILGPSPGAPVGGGMREDSGALYLLRDPA